MAGPASSLPARLAADPRRGERPGGTRPRRRRGPARLARRRRVRLGGAGRAADQAGGHAVAAAPRRGDGAGGRPRPGHLRRCRGAVVARHADGRRAGRARRRMAGRGGARTGVRTTRSPRQRLMATVSAADRGCSTSACGACSIRTPGSLRGRTMQHRLPVDALGPDGPAMAAAVSSCVHCGFCLPACPTYAVLGEEMDSPRGRIVLMKEALEGALPLADAAVHLDRCLGCLACETACPSGVRYRDLIEPVRERLAAARPAWRRAATSRLLNVMESRDRFRRALRLGRLARPVSAVLPATLRAMLGLLPATSPSAVTPRGGDASRGRAAADGSHCCAAACRTCCARRSPRRRSACSRARASTWWCRPTKAAAARWRPIAASGPAASTWSRPAGRRFPPGSTPWSSPPPGAGRG